MAYDLVIRGGQLGDIAVGDGKIEAIGVVREAGREEIDTAGLHIYPGYIDAHVHFNDPGRADWEGIDTGSRALAAGGGTLFFDMPLNAHPPTCDVAAFEAKRAAATGKSLVDFAFWGGLVPGNIDELEPLAECGVIGFKAFMSPSGIDDFSNVDHRTLREGMKRLAPLQQIVALHAEWPAKLKTPPLGRMSVRDYLESRPIAAEQEAIRIAIELAGETGCRLHIVHVSAGSSVDLITQARQQGVDVTCETCPHYLLLTDRDMERLGAVAKCAPPLRPGSEQELLWERVKDGSVLFLASDHSPSPWSMKTSTDFFKVWGGISSVQHAWPLLLSRFEPAAYAKLTAGNVADRFALPGKGKIEVGADADFALVRLYETNVVEAGQLFYRHQHSPYVGRKIRGKVVRTIARGRSVFADGKIVSRPQGRLVKPTRKS
ncbi:MAG: Allantoinase [Verrucomicrobiae bacterium]|nr:Allantoinase [Verrucomicrobiae bacterium]